MMISCQQLNFAVLGLIHVLKSVKELLFTASMMLFEGLNLSSEHLCLCDERFLILSVLICIRVNHDRRLRNVNLKVLSSVL